MAYESSIIPTAFAATSPLMEKLRREKKIACEFQERRHEAVNEIYELFRNRIRTNRLTQRQSVNVPLMKETIKTLLSKIDDPPRIEWKELAGDEEKEILLQEIWNEESERNNFEGVDIQDKKTVLMCGRGFKKLNWNEEGFGITALDFFDLAVDPLTDPLDLETARFLIQKNIFRSLREILADDRYDVVGKRKLKTYLASREGLVMSERNKEEWEKKMARLVAMGVNSTDFPLFAGGDVLINLTEHFTNVWNDKLKKFERRVVVYADDNFELLDSSLEDLLGVDFWPFSTWSEDIETADFWSDGPADLVRTPNKLINIWFSQLVENRTLRNFQMHWYDASIQGYKPQTYEPAPGRMLPSPGNPRDKIMPVEVSGLDDTLTSIDFVIRLIERGTAATAIEKGVSEKKDITLGEVNMLVAKASERTVAMAKFYRRSWQELAMKWYSMFERNQNRPMKLYKKSFKGHIWPKTIYPSDWRSKAGFRAFATSSSEQEAENIKAMQKFDFLVQRFPENMALRRIAERRMLEVADFTSEEMREVIAEEKKKQEMLERQMALQQQTAALRANGPQPAEGEKNESELEGSIGELSKIMDIRGAEEKLKELQTAT